MHDAFNETIDKLIAGGMDEYDAIALITQLLEQEARDFIQIDDFFKTEPFFGNPQKLIN